MRTWMLGWAVLFAFGCTEGGGGTPIPMDGSTADGGSDANVSPEPDSGIGDGATGDGATGDGATGDGGTSVLDLPEPENDGQGRDETRRRGSRNQGLCGVSRFLRFLIIIFK